MMTKIIKVFILAMTLIVGASYKVSAAKEQIFYNKINVQALAAFSNSGSFNQLTSKDNVSLDRAWTITFNDQVTMDKIDGIVIQKGSQFIPVNITINDNQSITIKPVNPYEKASKYSLKIFLSNGKKHSMDFTTEGSVITTGDPKVKSVEVSGREVQITFDRSMDVETAKDLSNYEINGKGMDTVAGTYANIDNNNTVVKLENISDGLITVGSNVLYIKNRVKDAYGNKVADDTRLSFEYATDETKPTVKSAQVIDSETIRVSFSEDVDYSYATNISNYKLRDDKNIDITNYIRSIYSASGESDTRNTDTFYIKLNKNNPNNVNEDWRLTGSKYTLTVINIIDTAFIPNTMDDYTATLNNDTTGPMVSGIYAYLRSSSGTGRDKVIIYFDKAMDTTSVINKDNYKFLNGEGNTKALPEDTTISVGGDNKSVIIEFPSNYYVKTNGNTGNGPATNVDAIIVSNVKDESGNILQGVVYNNNNKIDQGTVGSKVEEKAIKVYYSGDDLKADVQFDRAIDEINPSDFTLGGVTPTSALVSGSKATLTFKDGALATTVDKASAPTITYVNGKVNSNPTKIDLIKAQGQNAKLAIVSTGTRDEMGILVSRNSDGSIASLSNDQAMIYDYQADPRTTCDGSNATYWSATKDVNGGKVYITFDTPLDVNSGIKTDDFTFTGLNGVDIKADSVTINGNTIIFSFNTTNKDYLAFTGYIDIRAKSTVLLRTVKDADGNYANYIPSSNDLKKRTVIVNGTTAATLTK